jgi:hypothetical protein
MAKKAKPAFAGPLKEPIVRISALELLMLAGSETEVRKVFDDDSDRVFSLQFSKMPMLLDHYGIARDNPRCWQVLAWALAVDFVPGMEIVSHPPRKRGRTPKWKSAEGRHLLRDVDAIRNERRKGISDAVRIAIQRHPRWTQYKGKDRALEARYYEVRAANQGSGPQSIAKLTGLLALGAQKEAHKN